jgi:rhamnulokinase
MNNIHYLAIDLGAESGRVIAGTLENDQFRIEELHRFPNGLMPINGRLHWNIFRLYEQILEGLKIGADRLQNSPASIGIDTWGVDFALVARDGSLLGPPYAYRDPHTDGAMQLMFEKISREEIYELTGIQFLPFNSLYQLQALVRDNSPLLEAATRLLFVPDIFTYLLTGKMVTEFSFATTSQLYNPRSGTWEKRLLDTLGLPLDLLPKIVMPGTTIGSLSPDISRQTGLCSVDLTAVATHDTGSAVAAVPAQGDDWAFISSGTWSLMGIESKKPIISETSLAYNFTNEGGVNGSFRVLKNIAGLWLVQQCRAAWSRTRNYSYTELTELALNAGPAKCFIDPDDPLFINPPDMPRAIAEYCTRTGQKTPGGEGQTIRCVLESLALKYRWVLDQLREISGRDLRKIHIIGGGTQNKLLCQLTADATGLPVYAGPIEATAIGNLAVQAIANGRIENLLQARTIIAQSFEIEQYQPRNTAVWEKARTRFQALKPL